MSNNPFLKSKQESNRFHFLDSETPKKELPVKDKKPNYNYESSNNSFIKSSNDRPPSRQQISREQTFREQTSREQTSREQNKPSYNNSRPNSKDNFKKESNNYFRKMVQTSQPDAFTITDELFPSLTPISTLSKDNSTDFKNALKHQNTTIVTEDITLKPGWIQISRENNQIIINQEKLGPYEIKMQNIQMLHEDPNYIMNKAIDSMEKNWLKYKINYDNIYGEGAYDDLHYLSPVYDSDYDSDECESLSENDNLTDY